MTTSFPTSLDSFPTQADLANDTLATKAHSNLHANLGDSVAALEAKVGITSSASTSSLDYLLTKTRGSAPYNVTQPIGAIGPVLTTNSAATNTTNFQAMLSLGVFGAQNFIFPPGTYQMNGITLNYTGQRIFGYDNTSTTLEYHGSGAGNAFITIQGTDTGSYAGRTRNSGLHDICLSNAGTGDSIAIKRLSGTHDSFSRVFFTGWRRNAFYARDWADSTFWECEYEYCGSVDDSNKAVIDFSALTGGEWAVDQIGFVRNRFEACGDQIYKFDTNDGLYVNKIYSIGCKYESGGEMGGTVAQFSFGAANQIHFTDCDFTLQNMRGGHATIPAMMVVSGTSGVHLNNCDINLGGGSTKLFTYLFDESGADSMLLMNNVLVYTEASGNLPTNATRVQNSATFSAHNVGYCGGARSSGPNWVTGTFTKLDQSGTTTNAAKGIGL